jgi:cyclophilin family peptidyl-prolyl cis-trans isomerase
MQMIRNGNCQLGFSLLLIVVAVISLSLAGAIAGCASSEHKQHADRRGLMTTSDPIVVMETTKGTIKIEIFKNDAPITSANFLDLVGRGFYNGLTFHRYEPGFCIQGGDPSGTGMHGFDDPATGRERTIQLEVSPKLKHSEAGVIAMARSNDPNSASSQFYFTLGPASFLDGKYAVFGKVTDGLNVVMELRKGDKMTKVSVLETAKK